VALGGGGIRSSLPDAAVYVDASTVSPSLTGDLVDAFPRFVAMPILGSPDAVSSGKAVYLIGGDAAVIAVVEPLFPALTETVRRYGEAPLATTAKLAVNLLLLDGVVGLAESFTVGRSGGLSDDQLRELLGDSPMVAPGLHNRFEGILSGGQKPWWASALGAKDAGLAIDIVQQAGGALPATTTVRDLYRKVSPAPDADDVAAVADLYR
jgi:3-hydroxyisobutyrate dehydrogenase-like beta-hydroxyacid dehydrogenase